MPHRRSAPGGPGAGAPRCPRAATGPIERVDGGRRAPWIVVASSPYRTGSGLQSIRTASEEVRAMPPLEVRPFRRDDRDQLTALVNAHVAAVIPGIALSVNTVLSQ